MSTFLDLMKEYQRELRQCASNSSERVPFWRFFASKKTKEPRKAIAFVTTHGDNDWSNQAILHTLQSLEATLGKDKMPDFDIFTAELDPTRLQNKIFPHLQSNQDKYAAVVCLGTWCTMSMYEMTYVSSFDTPLVFVGVDDPIALRLINSYDKPGNNITGVKGVAQDYQTQISTLRTIRPDAKKVLIPYNPFNGSGINRLMERDTMLVTTSLEKYNFTPTLLPVSSHEGIKGLVVPRIDKYDTICLMPDALTTSHINDFVERCNITGTTLMTSSLDGVFRGAALGYGVSGSFYAPSCAHILYQLLTQDKLPKEIPVEQVKAPRTIRYNPNTISCQGITVTEAMRNLLNMVSITFEEAQLPANNRIPPKNG